MIQNSRIKSQNQSYSIVTPDICDKFFHSLLKWTLIMNETPGKTYNLYRDIAQIHDVVKPYHKRITKIIDAVILKQLKSTA